jgi:hypothetical protein
MNNLEDVIVLVFGAISSVAILIYYLNPKQSKCFDCQSLISHKKENRFVVSIEGEDNALCKKCFNARKRQDALVAQRCSCCSKEFTTRMKIHEWNTFGKSYFLCSSCNRKGDSKLTNNFQLADLLTDEFIRNNTDRNSLQEYVDSSKINIETQSDLDSKDWNNFIVNSSKFESWKEMEAQALHELYSMKRKSIIELLSE